MYYLNQSDKLPTSDCEKKLLRYEIRMKDGTYLPEFIELNQKLKKIFVRNPLLGTYVMQLVLRDVYGYSEALDFTLRVEPKLTSPSGIGNCYMENIV